jgi:hypothetical protein
MIREYSIQERVEPPQRARTIRQSCVRSRAEQWSLASGMSDTRVSLSRAYPTSSAAILEPRFNYYGDVTRA